MEAHGGLRRPTDTLVARRTDGVEDMLFVILTIATVLACLLAAVAGAESRPDVLRPDLRHRVPLHPFSSR